ncbi:MAG: TRAP transporter small permease subunit [Alkalilacustris sp.]
MKPALTRFVLALEGIVRVFGVLAAWVCLVLVLLVAGDVFARYLFRTGAVWAQELQWHLISPIALFGMSYALLSGEQVRVDILFDRFPALVQRGIEVLGGLIMVALGLWVAWLSLPWVEMSYARGEGSPNPGGLPYRFILKAMIPLGFTLLALQGLAHALRHAFALPTRAHQQG